MKYLFLYHLKRKYLIIISVTWSDLSVENDFHNGVWGQWAVKKSNNFESAHHCWIPFYQFVSRWTYMQLEKPLFKQPSLAKKIIKIYSQLEKKVFIGDTSGKGLHSPWASSQNSYKRFDKHQSTSIQYYVLLILPKPHKRLQNLCRKILQSLFSLPSHWGNFDWVPVKINDLCRMKWMKKTCGVSLLMLSFLSK